MRIATPAFLTAFFAGLAAPVALWARPVNYVALIGDFSVPASFGRVAAQLKSVLPSQR